MGLLHRGVALQCRCRCWPRVPAADAAALEAIVTHCDDFTGCLLHDIQIEVSTGPLITVTLHWALSRLQATRRPSSVRLKPQERSTCCAAGQEVDSPRPTKQPRRAGQQAVTHYVRRAPAPAAAAAVRKKADAVGPLQAKVGHQTG